MWGGRPGNCGWDFNFHFNSLEVKLHFDPICPSVASVGSLFGRWVGRLFGLS